MSTVFISPSMTMITRARKALVRPRFRTTAARDEGPDSSWDPSMVREWQNSRPFGNKRVLGAHRYFYHE